MSEDKNKAAIIDALLSVAPEFDPSTLDPNRDLREQCDLDSMDFLNFVIALHQALDVNIPEADYPELATFERALRYLNRHLDGSQSGLAP